MNSALKQASDRLDYIRERCRKAAQTGTVETILGAGYSNGADLTLQSHTAQLAAFKGWVYAAVSLIGRRLAGQPCYVGVEKKSHGPRSKFGRKSMLDTIEPIDSHVLLDLMADPNEFSVRFNLLYCTICALELAGKAFWWLADSDRPDVRRFDLWYLPPTWVRRSDENPFIWLVRPGGAAEEFPVPSDRMAYFSMPDPADPRKSLSTTQAIAESVDVDFKLQRSQSRALDNGIFPGLALIAGNPDGTGTRGNLDKSQRDQLINAVRARYRGYEKAGEPLILDGLITDVKSITNKPSEMGWLESEASVKARVLQVFGVSEILLGAKGSNRAEATVAEEILCDHVVNPLAELMSQVITAWLLPAFGDSGLIFWIEPCRAKDQQRISADLKLAADKGAITKNELRTMLLGMKPIAGGDVLIDAAKTPATANPRKPAEDAQGDETASSDDEDEPAAGIKSALLEDDLDELTSESVDDSDDDPSRAWLLALWLTTHTRLETQFAADLDEYQAQQAQEVGDNLIEGFDPSKPPGEIVDGIFDSEKWTARLKEIALIALLLAMRSGAQIERDRLGGPANDSVDNRIEQLAADTLSQSYWDGITATTRSLIETVIAKGIADGKTAAEIAADVRAAIIDHERALNIARTEITGAMNGGMDVERQERNALGTVQWISMEDAHVRPTHVRANGSVVPVGTDFNVGGFLAPYPCHPSLPPEERCNCRCIAVTSNPTVTPISSP